MDDGKIVERSTYSHIRQGGIDRLLSSIQFTHQALAYRYSGVDIQSQEAYELASKGLVRPIGRTKPILYNIKCSRLALPEFTLGIPLIYFLNIYFHKIKVMHFDILRLL
ncbi:pseudouridylate synthase TRUB2, mitochondrial-like [Parasteatoda tepidariorum]|uniref:pseudouridylate synthase TRUB2, mitochondrial-like n=1 Tax=Parasteatoda tepidariorum TaxID=114398 RepID=UPI001C71CA14|nr:mitochondrial mRNA pseudouridine synthase Trub2-like [Parasteatoda tepidariorum]